jgi:hypothetical protein
MMNQRKAQTLQEWRRNGKKHTSYFSIAESSRRFYRTKENFRMNKAAQSQSVVKM